MVFALVLFQTLSSAVIVEDALRQVDAAEGITVTQLRTTEEFPRNTRWKYWFRKGGYFRADAGTLTDISNPKEGWTFDSVKKIYQSRKPIPSDFRLTSVIGIDILRAGLPIIGQPKAMQWRGRPTVRVELDGRAKMTKETKLFVFFDPKSHLPIGVSANLGSMTQVVVYEDLKLNPKIEDSKFQFVPPKTWKKVTATSGGWK